MTNQARPKWVTDVGLELTWVPNIDASTYTGETLSDNFAEAFSELLDHYDRFYPLKIGTWHKDPGCVELSTKIIRSWEEAKSVWTKAETRVTGIKVGKVKLQPKHETVVGCGGHIHVDMPNKLQQVNIFRDWARQPWLGWAFSDPQDTKNCRSPILESNWLDCSAHRALTLGDRRDLLPWNGMLPSGKDTAIRFTHQTVEFRAFDRARTWKEQEAHLMFVQKYMAWVKKQDNLLTMPSIVQANEVKRGKWLKNLPKTMALEGFQETIETLGLPWERFRPFRRNIEHRYEKRSLLV